VASIAVSDGVVLYAADVRSGGLQQRIACRLEHGDPQQALWWLSVHGIYRQPPQLDGQLPERQAESRADARGQQQATGEVPLHGKYKLPASCFAYVGDPSDPRSWHLPYLNADGSVDGKRLPGAIRAILSNYRGANVSAIPESAVPECARAAGVRRWRDRQARPRLRRARDLHPVAGGARPARQDGRDRTVSSLRTAVKRRYRPGHGRWLA
jgi:hypothetical protein